MVVERLLLFYIFCSSARTSTHLPIFLVCRIISRFDNYNTFCVLIFTKQVVWTGSEFLQQETAPESCPAPGVSNAMILQLQREMESLRVANERSHAEATTTFAQMEALAQQKAKHLGIINQLVQFFF